MANRSIVVQLRAEIAGFKRAMTEASTSAKKAGKDTAEAFAPAKAVGLTKSIQEQRDHFSRLGTAATVAGGAIALGLGLGIKAAANFDTAFSGVRAALPQAQAQYAALRAEAIKLGADSQFSAAQAAEGITALAKAGVDARAILGGGLKGALDLAAAGQIEVAAAAEIAASAMTQFKLKGEAVPHIADLLAAGAGKAQGSVADLGMALNQSGLVAAGFGLSIEETTGGLAAFASAGLIGSDAGTSFKTMLQRLVPQGEQAQKLVAKLGVSAFDASGHFIGLAKYAGLLHDKMKDLTPEARASAEGIIFGTDAVRAANVLYQQGQSGIQGWIDKTNDAGFAAKQASILTDNLSGDLERFKGALDSAFVQNGGGVNNALRGLTKAAEGAVNGFNGLPQSTQGGIVALAGIAAAGLLTVGAFAKIVTSSADVFESMGKIRERGGVAAGGLNAATRSAKIFALALVGLSVAAQTTKLGGGDEIGVDSLTAKLLSANDIVGTLSQSFKAAANDNWFDNENVKSFGDALRYTFDPSVASKADNVLGSITSAFGGDNLSDIALAAKRFSEVDAALSKLVSGGNSTDAARIFGALEVAANKAGVGTDELKSKLPGYTEALAAAGNAATLAGDGAKDGSVGVKALGDEAATAAQKADDLNAALRGLGGGFRSERQAARDYRDALKAVKDSLGVDDKGKQKATSDQRQQALDRLAQSTLDYAAAADKQGKSDAAVAAIVKIGRAEFLKQAHALGIGTKAANALADAEGLIPDEVTSLIKVPGADEAKGKVEGVTAAVNKVPLGKSIKIATPQAAENRKRIEDITTAVGKVPLAKSITIATPGAVENRRRIGDLHDELGNLPPSTRPKVDVVGLVTSRSGVAGLQSTIDGLHGKTIYVHTVFDSQIAAAQGAQNIARLKDTWVGGYTGDGGKYEPKGIVHGGEYVTTKETTSRWRSLLEWMHAGNDPRGYFGVPGYAGGGFVQMRPASSVPVVSGPSSHSESWDQRIDTVNLYARDFDDAQRQIDDKRRLARLGGRRAR